jgi:hypothetical protein
MMSGAFRHLPLDKARPDSGRFIDVVMGRARSERPPLVEYLIDDVVRKPITTELLGRAWVDPAPGNREGEEAYLDNFIAFWHRLGYDFVRFEESLPFVENELVGSDPSLADGRRHWRDMRRGAIADWADFERYPWPWSLRQAWPAMNTWRRTCRKGWDSSPATPEGCTSI